MEFAIEVTPAGACTVLTISGDLDVAAAPQLRAQVADLVDRGQTNLVVSLEGVDFLDSMGLGVLLGAQKRVRDRDGWLSLVCTKPTLLKVFDLSGLTGFFAIHESVATATSS